jgi:hypothetical protein
VQNCRGSIEFEYEDRRNAWAREKRLDLLKDLAKRYQQQAYSCSTAIDMKAMYRKLDRCDLTYGPAFQIAKSQKVGLNNEAVAEVLTFKGDGEELQPRVIHPVTFDAISHLCFTAFTAGGKKPMATSMPQKLEYAWVSSCGLATQDASSVQIFSTIVGEMPRGFDADYVVVDAANCKEVRLCISGLKLALVSEIPTELTLPNPQQRWYNIEQKVDLSMLSWDKVGHCLQGLCTPSSAPVHMAYKYIELAAHQLPDVRICQFASGSGEQTRQIIYNALDSHHVGDLMCGQYVFADSVRANLELAKHAFSIYGSKMDFQVFDPLCKSTCDGFEAQDHDILIVLGHDWTRETLQRALEDLRMVLKSGGTLIIEEPTKNEEKVSSCSWDDDSNSAGFSGVYLRLDSGGATNGIIISTAMEGASVHEDVPARLQIILVGNFASKRHLSLIARLTELLQRDVTSCIFGMSLAEVSQHSDMKNCFLVMLSDPEHLCLESLNQESLEQLQRIVPNAPDILWISDVTAESCIDGSSVSAIIEGASRSLRFEHNGTRIVTLVLSSFDGKKAENHIYQVMRKMLETPAGSNYEQ